MNIMGTIKSGYNIDYAELQKVVIGDGKPKRRADAPEFRLTAQTFQANAGIYEWALAGNLVRAIDNYNKGGVYDTSAATSWPREFWLMRIFDAMEHLGKEQFDKFVPGVWDSALDTYYATFANKITQKMPDVSGGK